MAVFDKLQRASFGGIEFPIRSARMRCDFRHFEHVYLKTPGAATEKMSRGLYRVEMDAAFDANVRGYGQLWPTALAALRRAFEQGTTADLVIPTVGTIPAWMPVWEQEMNVKVRSGERVPFVFQEDNSTAFVESALSSVTSTSVPTNHAALQSFAKDLNPRPDIFDKIQDAVNDVLGFVDQANLEQSLLAAKIAGLADLINQCDREVEQLQDPSNYQVIYALHDLLASVLRMARDLTQQQGEAGIYVLPRTMSVAQISTAIYKDTSHFNDIVSNNRIEDPFAVPAGTQIIYFKNNLLNAA